MMRKAGLSFSAAAIVVFVFGSVSAQTTEFNYQGSLKDGANAATGNSVAQASETFDIATFQPPKGWQRQASENAIQFSTSNNADYCLITLYKSIPGLVNPKENFDAAWQMIVKEAVSVSTAPQMASPVDEDGWKVLSGFAPFEKDGNNGIAMLVTASGFGKMVNILVLR